MALDRSPIKCLFHQNFKCNVCADIFAPKNYEAQMQLEKFCLKHFRTKIFRKKIDEIDSKRRIPKNHHGLLTFCQFVSVYSFDKSKIVTQQFLVAFEDKILGRSN